MSDNNAMTSRSDSAGIDAPYADLSADELRARLLEADAVLHAIRNGLIDAVIAGDETDGQVYTRESADRSYRALVEQMQESALVLSGDGTIVFCNARTEEIMQRSSDTIVGRRLSELLVLADQARFSDLFDKSSLGPVRAEMSLCVGARELPVSVSLKGLVQTNDDPRTVCVVLSDLSQQREVEARLRQAQKMEAVGQLTGGLAHDFNNLLQVIAGNLELIRRLPATPPKVSEWSQNATRAVERGSRLTAQLLAFSRHQEVALAAVSVSPLIRGLADLFARTLGASVTVNLELCADDVAALADPTQLELAVLNLAINARDAMEGHGALTITTSSLAIRDDVELAQGDYVRIDVTDTGAGMSAEVAARAFEPFFTTKATGAGTGLGLAQVYGICRQAKGTARITRTALGGTTVSLLLRQVDAKAPASHTEDGSTPAAIGKDAPLILVIDDDADVRSLTVETLHTIGYRTRHAGNGKAALADMAAVAPDLLLIDYAMPGMNGAELAEIVRSRGDRTPIIFASGYADTTDLKQSVGGHCLILRKPFSIRDLADAVVTALRL